MGAISEETKLGIITLVDEEYNYVWSAGLEGLELRFKHNPGVKFECGEIIRFIQSHPTKSIQIVHNLMKSKDTLPIEKDPKVTWKVKMPLTFAPKEFFAKFKKEDGRDRVTALAYNDSFNLVASYVEEVKYEPGVVYEAYISRVPRGHEAMAEKVGTVFLLVGGKKGFSRSTNQIAIDNIIKGCPWKDKIMPSEFENNEETGLSEVPSNHSNSVHPVQNGNGTESDGSLSDNGQNQQSSNFEGPGNAGPSKKLPSEDWWEKYREEGPLTDDFAKQLHDQMEGDEHIGLIVGSEKEYSVIWSPKYGLVRLQLEKYQNPANPIWDVATWVKFRCFPERSQLLEHRTCEHTAYDVRKAMEPRGQEVRAFGRSEHEFGKGLIARMYLHHQHAYSTSFFLAEDNFYGRVLCPMKDRNFLNRFEELSSTSTIEVMAVFSYEFQHSKWIVFTMLSEDSQTWTKLEGLPPTIDTDVQTFFRVPSDHFHENQLNSFHATNKFKPPTGWHGVLEEGEKLIDVLGVVVFYEEDTSVIATAYGLARQPIKWDLGTWVRAKLKPDEEDSPFTYPNVMRDQSSYIVEKSNKIPPIVSTRVVDHNGVDVVLICCSVKKNVDGILKNDYLGTVYDVHKRLEWTAGSTGRSITELLVEINLSRAENNKNIRFWKVLKGHGEYTSTVKTVALKLSYFQTAMGRTCDEAHNILCDSEFDLQKHLEEQKKKSANKGPSRNTPASQLSQQPSSSNQPVPQYEVGPSTKINRQPSHGNATGAHQSTSNSHSNNESGHSQLPPGIRGDQQANLNSQLHLYEPVGKHNKRALGIVVTKKEQFAILYSREFGDCIVLANNCSDRLQFEQIFQLGYVVGVEFAAVADQKKRGLIYSFMCLPEFKPNRKSNAIKARSILNHFVQIYIKCEFTKTNVKECIEDLDSNEREKQYYIDTDVGKVLLNQDVLDKNELFGKVVKLWITHIQKRYGCYWQIALGDGKTLQELKVSPEDPSIHEIIVEIEREPGHPTSFSDYYNQPKRSIPKDQQSDESSIPGVDPCPLLYISDDTSSGFSASPATVRASAPNIPSHVKRMTSSGYVDFAFGSRVPDVMNGGRYPTERYVRQFEMHENNEDSDPEETEERELGEIFGSSSSEGENNSDERAESFHTDNNFSDEDDRENRGLRITGGSSPIPARRHPASQPLREAAGPSFGGEIGYNTPHGQETENKKCALEGDLISF